MSGNAGRLSGPAAGRRLFILSLWYFPSRFGLHVVDIAAAFSRAGYDVTIVTVAKAAFDLPYFDAFREAFDVAAGDWPQLVRLNLESLEDRGAYNPRLAIRRDSTFRACLRQMESGPCYLLHFFEMFLPYFNSETVASAVVTSLLYAGNFITRIIGQRLREGVAPISPDFVVETLLHPYSVAAEHGGYRLRGVACVFSETRELARMLHSTRLRTRCWWTSRPVFVAPVLAAPPCDLHVEFGIPERAKVLLYAGRPAKNARALLSILRLVRSRHAHAPVILLLVGVRGQELSAWPGACGVRESVRTVPFVSRTRLLGIMKSADVFVYPGLVDGYPKVISEAQLARLPVVAFSSPASGVREVATDGATALLVDVASEAETSERENREFAAAVTRILTERTLRDALVERASLAAMQMDAPHFVNRLERLWARRGAISKAG
ncbi:MAG: glycosyltransferase family 4 protein [Acetobacteraceae bacterium]